MKRFSHTRRWAALLACAAFCAPSLASAQYEPEGDAEEAWEPEGVGDVETEAVPVEEIAPVRARPRRAKSHHERVDLEPLEPAPTTVSAAPPPPTRWDTGSRTIGWVEREANTEVIFGGVFVLSSAYLFSAMAAAGSPVKADEQLYIPLVGPWLDLAQRPHCGPTKDRPSCRTEPANVTLLVTSGIAQSIGTLIMLGGALFPKMRVVSRRTADVHFVPEVAPGAAGLSAFGELLLL